MKRLALLASLAFASACGGSNQLSVDEIVSYLGLPGDMVALCGDARLVGREIDDIRGSGGCGISDPVRLYAVGKVALNPPARINCGTATAFRDWVESTVRPAAREEGTEVAGMRVAASYACRTRNHRRGARLSEHARGNAIDISEIRLENGDTATVLRDYRRGDYSGMMRKIHKGACGTFGTTLGPGSDGYHEDHFHYDIADHRNGPYCR